MYGAATAVIAIPRTVSAVIEIASPHCSMERSVLKVAFRIVRRQTGSKKCAAPWLLTTAAPASCGGQRRQPFGLGGADPGNIESNTARSGERVEAY